MSTAASSPAWLTRNLRLSVRMDYSLMVNIQLDRDTLVEPRSMAFVEHCQFGALSWLRTVTFLFSSHWPSDSNSTIELRFRSKEYRHYGKAEGAMKAERAKEASRPWSNEKCLMKQRSSKSLHCNSRPDRSGMIQLSNS